jgi:AAA domain
MEGTLNAPLTTKATVKMILTQDDKQALHNIGYSDETISNITPETGAGIIAQAIAQPIRPVALTPLFENAPLVLRTLKQWICWRYEWRRGKWDKVPHMALLGLSKDGTPYRASTAKPAHWKTFNEARTAYLASQKWSESFDGIGFVFDGEVGADGLCWCGIDFDAWTELERGLFAMIGPTYAEWSPSGRGVHTIARSRPFIGVQSNANPRDPDSGKLRAEAYSWRRFFTFTGRLLDGAPATVEALPDEIERVVIEIELARAKTSPLPRKRSRFNPNHVPITQAKIFDDWLASLPDGGASEWDVFNLPEEPVDIVKLASAMAMLAEELFLEGNWVNIPCRALANEAARANDPLLTEQLFDLLDDHSQDKPGYNSREDNREVFDRCARYYKSAGRPILSGSIYTHAEANGWVWPPALQGLQGATGQGVAGAGNIPQFGIAAPAITDTFDWLRGIHDYTDPREWAYGVRGQYGEVSVLAAAGGSGKTMLNIVDALAYASGKPLVEHKVYIGPQKVLFISAEEKVKELQRRFRAAARRYNITEAEFSNIAYRGLDTKDSVRLELVEANGRVGKVNNLGMRRLEGLIVQSGARAVFLDPLNNFVSGGLSDNSTMTVFFDAIERLAMAYNVSMHISHHTNKGSLVDPDNMEGVMGASAIINRPRFGTRIAMATDEERTALGAPPRQTVFRLVDGKHNNSPIGDEEQWYAIRSINLGNTTTIYQHGDNVGVLEVLIQQAGTTVSANSLHEYIVLKAINSAAPNRLLSPTKQCATYYGDPLKIALKQAGETLPAKKGGPEKMIKALVEGLLVARLIEEVDFKNVGRKLNTGFKLTDAGLQRLQVTPVGKSNHVPSAEITAGVFKAAKTPNKESASGAENRPKSSVPPVRRRSVARPPGVD